jgi:hypothetical protein
MTETTNIDGTAKRAVAYNRGDINMAGSSQFWSRPSDERYLTLEDMLVTKFTLAKGSNAVTIQGKDLEIWAPENVTDILDTQVLQVRTPDGMASTPTNWSFQQLCALVKAPASYLRDLPSQLVADNLQYGVAHHRPEMVKLYNHSNGTDTLRAVTGPDYGRIFDHELIEAIKKIKDQGAWKVPGVMDWSTGMYDPMVPVTKETTTLFASDRDCWVFLCDDTNPIEVGKLPNGDPDLLFRGFYGWNSEVGFKTAGVATFYLRGVCCNRIFWGVEGFSEISIRHSKNAPDRFMWEALPALESYSTGSVDTVIEGVALAKDAKVADDEEKALEFLNSRKFSRKVSRDILALTHEEGEKLDSFSVWDMAQGITQYAQTIPHQDKRVEVETVARVMLDKVAA